MESNIFDASTDMDVFDSMRALLDSKVNLDDRTAVERVLINPYDTHPEFGPRFVDWCIKSAKANLASGGLEGPRNENDPLVCSGFVPPEFDASPGVTVNYEIVELVEPNEWHMKWTPSAGPLEAVS